MTTPPSLDKILDRIKKLHAKAESCREIGSIAEAESFAAAVQKMLDMHKLEMSDVEIAAQDRDDPMGEEWIEFTEPGSYKSKRVAWTERLASVIARAHYCRILIRQGSNRVAFVGRHSDREIASYMFATLYRAATKMADKDYRRYISELVRQGERAAPGYKASWLTGFVNTIQTRYSDRHVARGAALVRADAEVTQYMKANYPGRGTPLGRLEQNHLDGLLHGRRAGGSVSLTPNAVNSPAQQTAQRRLGA